MLFGWLVYLIWLLTCVDSFPGEYAAFDELPVDARAEALVNITQMQAQHGFSFVYAIVQGHCSDAGGCDVKCDTTRTVTTQDGPYRGASLLSVIERAVHGEKTAAVPHQAAPGRGSSSSTINGSRAFKTDETAIDATGATGVARTPPLGFNTWNQFACPGINAGASCVRPGSCLCDPCRSQSVSSTEHELYDETV